MKKTITLSLLSSLLLNNVYAAPIELDEVTVEAANRTEQNIKDLTESVTIITAEDIAESKVTTLADALNRLGNIAMANTGGMGKQTSLYVRGMDTGRTLLLVDGIRYNNTTTSSGAQYQNILLNDVERIEIIKGSQSGVWGADASAGVINVVTKSASKGTHVSANIEAGSFNTQQGSVQLSHKTDAFDIVAGVSRIKTDGFSAAEPKQGTIDYGKRGDELGWEDDGYTNNTYNIKLGYNITENDRIETSYKRIDSFVEFDASAALDAENYDDPWTSGTDSPWFEKNDDRFYSAAFKHKDNVNDLALQYNYSYFNRKVSAFKGNVKDVSLQDRINYAEDSFLRIGGSYQTFTHEKVQSSTIDKDYSDKAVYVTNYNKFSDLLSFGNTIFTQSLRHDNYSSFQDKTTGKIGLKQFVHDDIYLSTNYGTAYNIPTLYQFFDPSYGEVDLTPETTKTTDITIGNDNLTLTYFYNKVTDMIGFDMTTWKFTNLEGTSRLKGVELGYVDDFFDVLSVNVNYTYLDAKDADGKALARRPKHQVDGNIVYYVSEDLNIGLNGQYIGTRYDTNSVQTGKYTVFNTVVNYVINDNFTIYGKIDNITDKYYQIVDGYATAERSYYAGLNAKF